MRSRTAASATGCGSTRRTTATSRAATASPSRTPRIADRRALAPGSDAPGRRGSRCARLRLGRDHRRRGVHAPVVRGDARRDRPRSCRPSRSPTARSSPTACSTSSSRSPPSTQRFSSRSTRTTPRRTTPFAVRGTSRMSWRRSRGSASAAFASGSRRPLVDDAHSAISRRSASCTAASACPTRITSSAGSSAEGRAASEHLGTELGPNDVLPELTLTADGVFLHPFAPTVRGRRHGDRSARRSRSCSRSHGALGAFLDHPATQARGADVVRNVR